MSTEHRSEVEELKVFKAKTALEGTHFRDMRNIPVHHRPLRGNSTVHFNLSGNKAIQAHVSELIPGGCSRKHRHLNEAIIYIVCGKGYSIVQNEGEEPVRIDWEEGDLFAPPIFAWHQHFNTQTDAPARYLAITTTPLMENLGLVRIEQFTEAAGNK